MGAVHGGPSSVVQDDTCTTVAATVAPAASAVCTTVVVSNSAVGGIVETSSEERPHPAEGPKISIWSRLEKYRRRESVSCQVFPARKQHEEEEEHKNGPVLDIELGAVTTAPVSPEIETPRAVGEGQPPNNRTEQDTKDDNESNIGWAARLLAMYSGKLLRQD